MFERGRILGKLETEAKWQVKDAGQRTRQALKDAAARLQKERDEDWSNLDNKELLKRLVEKKVISIKGGDLMDSSMTEAFGELCKEYLLKQQEQRSLKVKKERGEEKIEDVSILPTEVAESPGTKNTQTV